MGDPCHPARILLLVNRIVARVIGLRTALAPYIGTDIYTPAMGATDAVALPCPCDRLTIETPKVLDPVHNAVASGGCIDIAVNGISAGNHLKEMVLVTILILYDILGQRILPDWQRHRQETKLTATSSWLDWTGLDWIGLDWVGLGWIAVRD